MADVSEFYAAITAGDLGAVRQMVDETPALLGEPGPDGASAALTALYHGHGPLADELAARTGELSVFEAAAFDDTDRLVELVTAERAVVDRWSEDGWQPLHLAAYFGRAEAARVLLDADAVVDEPSRNPIHVYPLHAAAAGGHSELVWLLIASDAPVDARQPQGYTALHSAARNSDTESVRALLAAGADPTLSTADGVTPRDLATDAAILALFDGQRD